MEILVYTVLLAAILVYFLIRASRNVLYKADPNCAFCNGTGMHHYYDIGGVEQWDPCFCVKVVEDNPDPNCVDCSGLGERYNVVRDVYEKCPCRKNTRGHGVPKNTNPPKMPEMTVTGSYTGPHTPRKADKGTFIGVSRGAAFKTADPLVITPDRRFTPEELYILADPLLEAEYQEGSKRFNIHPFTCPCCSKEYGVLAEKAVTIAFFENGEEKPYRGDNGPSMGSSF
jgi:hypothetical protein